MAKVTTKSKNKKKNLKKQKKLILMILSGVVALSILCSVFFGFKLYAYGKDVKIIYNSNGATLSSQTQTVEVCKRYTLLKPTRSGYTFLYWSTNNKADGRVATKGIWLASTDDEVRLYAVWEKNEDAEYTSNY